MALKRAGVILVAEKYDEYMAKLRDVNRAHQETFGKKPPNKVPEAIDDTQKKIKEMQAAFGQLKMGIMQAFSGDVLGGIANIGSALGKLGPVALAIMVAMEALKKVMQFKEFINQSIEVATRNETMGVVLENVGKNAGYTADQVKAAEKSVKAMGITTSVARKTLTDMAQAGIEWTNSSKLARTAQDAAVIGNINSSEAFQRMIYGIKSGQTEILRNIGLQVNFEAAYRKMATQLGKSTGQLTEQEKVQARANAVMEEGAKIAGTYEAAMGTAGKMQSSMERYIEETQNSLGNMLLPLKTASIEFEYKLWQGISKAAKGLENFGAVVQSTINLTKEMITAFAGFEFPEAEAAGKGFGKTLHESAQFWAKIIILTQAAVAGLAHMFDVIQAKLDTLVSSGTFDTLVNVLQYGSALATPGGPVTFLAKEYGKKLGETYGEAIGGVIAPKPAPTLKEAELAQQQAVEEAKRRQKLAGEDVGAAFDKAALEKLDSATAELLKQFPDLFKDYEDAVNDIDLAPRKSASEELIEQLNKEKEALAVQAQVMQKVKGIYDGYTKALTQAAKSREKAQVQAEKDHIKAQENLEKKSGKALVELLKDSGKSRRQIIKDYNKLVVEQERQRNRDLEQERRRFELSKLQATRQFQLSERRLMAEGDILGLQRLREDFDLQRKEAGENFNLQNQERKETAQEQSQQQQREMQERLRELEENIAERRGQIFESYATEMQDLATANEEKKAQIAQAYQEQLDNAKAARDEQLQALGEALQNEQTMTKEGMDAIAKILAETFGEQGAADALMKGWSERATDAVSVAMDNIINKITNIENRIRNLQEGPSAPRPAGAKGGPHAAPLPGSYGMRQGGVGVVTGPALFEVEPGVREAFAFAPIPLGGTRALNVNVGGGIDVRGAAGASPGIVDAAVQQTMSEITLAFRALSRRR